MPCVYRNLYIDNTVVVDCSPKSRRGGILKIVSRKVGTIVAGEIGCVDACFVPYRGLINIMCRLNGYLGFLQVFIMMAHDIKFMIKK